MVALLAGRNWCYGRDPNTGETGLIAVTFMKPITATTPSSISTSDDASNTSSSMMTSSQESSSVAAPVPVPAPLPGRQVILLFVVLLSVCLSHLKLCDVLVNSYQWHHQHHQPLAVHLHLLDLLVHLHSNIITSNGHLCNHVPLA
jgi:hypothetical protein